MSTAYIWRPLVDPSLIYSIIHNYLQVPHAEALRYQATLKGRVVALPAG